MSVENLPVASLPAVRQMTPEVQAEALGRRA
jgi:hypothetical protein